MSEWSKAVATGCIWFGSAFMVWLAADEFGCLGLMVLVFFAGLTTTEIWQMSTEQGGR